MDKKFLLFLASSQMQVAGQMLQAQDTNTTGRDDVIGKLLSTGGKALGSYSAGDIKSVDASLKLIADSIYDYQGQQPPR
ncbi:MAG TPA: hypothetical protein VJU84_08690 [Pyrinomonadaceae bacterium]|nr:hypothetical protein [Pyrinomonadaceae bacterium]